MRLKPRQRPEPHVPTSSMADIAFLLIIFFMWTFTVEVDRTQVTLPRTEIRTEIPRDSAYVSITSDGELRVSDGHEMSTLLAVEDISAFAADLASRHPDRGVVLKVDEKTHYKHVDLVMDGLKQGGIKMIYLLSHQLVVDSQTA